MEFEEKQQLKLWWLYILLGIETIIVVSVMFLDKGGLSYQDLKDSYFLPILAILLPYALVFVITNNSFRLRINEHGIHYSYWPFARNKTITWPEVNQLYIRKYDALVEYGGWGLKHRLWFKFNDKAYILNDQNLGLQVELTNQKKVLFSTAKPEELNLFLINLKRTNHLEAIATDVRER